MILSTEYDRMLSLASKAAVAAGNAVTEQWEASRSQVRFKGPSDLVTGADLLSDEIIQAAIKAEFPLHRILSEEDADSHRFDYSGPLWIIDPIDGTANYARGHPYFGISVAFAMDGEVLAGCVHAPALGETFTAAKGQGAFLNGRPIRASSPDSLARSIVSTGFPHEKSDPGPLLERVRIILSMCQDIRRGAAPVLDIAYVAAGRLDAHTETLFPWDVAAAGLIATEAGATRSHLAGVSENIPPDLSGNAVLFSSPAIHDEIAAHLRR
jgi:myo-inositol-1(or 4)-monophosphatase